MVNIKDVAIKANVSVMTVSRVINNSNSVSLLTRQKVQAAIEELNYLPNKLAQGLAGSSTKTIGVLFSNIYNQAYTSIIDGIEKRAKDKDYNVMISNATDYKSAISALQMLVSKMVDGIIILPVEFEGINDENTYKKTIDDMCKFYDYLKDAVSRWNIPCVVVDMDITGEKVQYIHHDFNKAFSLGLEYLFSRGYKKIYHINNRLKQGLWEQRLNIYVTKMQEKGLDANIRISYCSNTTESAYNLITELLKSGERPEVFYCANDVMAIGAIQAINAFGLRVPQDISVMGNDGIMVGEMIVPALSTVTINSYNIGIECVNSVCDMAAGKPHKDEIGVNPDLLIRKSVK